MARLDPHSYCDDTQAQTESFALTARVDFASKTLSAEVTLTFNGSDAMTLTSATSPNPIPLQRR